MLAEMTRLSGRGRRRAPRMFAIATLVICTVMALAAGGTTAMAQEDPDAAAAARAKAQAERRARCAPLHATQQQYAQQYKSARDQEENARRQFNTAADAYNNALRPYVAVRNSGEHVRAWQMMPSVDKAWAVLGHSSKSLLSARTARLSAARSVCASVSSLAAANCISSGTAARCPSSMKLDQLTNNVGHTRNLVMRYARTWKTAADEKLNPENAQKGCPIAKAIAPRATVTAVAGRVFIVRGVRATAATVGSTVHPGDVIAVEDDSSASINLFSTGSVRISEKTKFEIPSPEKAPPPPGIAASAWAKAKKLFEGETFEIETPLRCGGVRG